MNHTVEKQVGNNIRILRERANMTQEVLAAKLQLHVCDITRSAVAKIEVGQRHLYPDEIILIKKSLNVRYEDIFDNNKINIKLSSILLKESINLVSFNGN